MPRLPHASDRHCRSFIFRRNIRGITHLGLAWVPLGVDPTVLRIFLLKGRPSRLQPGLAFRPGITCDGGRQFDSDSIGMLMSVVELFGNPAIEIAFVTGTKGP
jgi:hypothetical protein